ncbi:MAG: class I SAM-dependent methyltransferase [Gemmataceae bacterium]|nr:class I SAM-dependent methyltransferase [Gemmataceae bacterium]
MWLRLSLPESGPCPARPDRESDLRGYSFQNQEELAAATELIAILMPNIFVELNSYHDTRDSLYLSAIEHLDHDCEIFHAKSITRDRAPLPLWQETPERNRQYSKTPRETFPSRPLSPREPHYEWEINDTPQSSRKELAFSNGSRKSHKVYSYQDFQDRSIDLLHINGFLDDESLAEELRMWLPKISSQGVILCQTPAYLHDESSLYPMLVRLAVLEFSCPQRLMAIFPSSSIPKELRRLKNPAPSRNSMAIPQQFLAPFWRVPRVIRKKISAWFTRKPVPLYRDLLATATPVQPYRPQSVPTKQPQIEPAETPKISLGS